MSRHLRLRNRALGSPRVASTAYQWWPTWSRTIRPFERQHPPHAPPLPPSDHGRGAPATPRDPFRHNAPLGASARQWPGLGFTTLVHVCSLTIGRRAVALRSPSHALLDITKLGPRSAPGSSYPEGNFEGNQLLGGSMSLSPLYTTPTIDLHVRIAYQPPPRFPMASL